MKIGVLGTGSIAATLSDTFNKMNEVECYAVASRNIDKANKFKEKYHYEKAYGSYVELVQDPNVELVYVATPHSTHYECMKLCIENHKPVLCEKAFCVNAKQAKEIYELSKKNNVFVSEALWPRYMPSRKLIDDVISSGIIGKPNILTGNLSYVIYQIDRLVNPELAGGALLDVGVYGLNFALMHFGDDIERIETSVKMSNTNVDGMETITLFYKDGRMANLTHGLYSRSDRKGIIWGDKGYIVVENINNPNSIKVFDCEDKLIKEVIIPEQISGYEYEFLECKKCLEEGRIESISMPLKESIKLMEITDKIRNIWGLKYPFE
ncbi:MAG: Gfo/Idh/MocA family oxidoreductase [Erysipelotrichaceae bacterium]|nr:Gfo/Idh/MocA family oxidoreductase [Erysipelotrichaceae bacterium]